MYLVYIRFKLFAFSGDLLPNISKKCSAVQSVIKFLGILNYVLESVVKIIKISFAKMISTPAMGRNTELYEFILFVFRRNCQIGEFILKKSGLTKIFFSSW